MAELAIAKEEAMLTDLTDLAEGNSAFALDLYHQLRQREGNLFFSPFSISMALAMTYAGARGRTAAQMAQALHFRLDQERLHPAFGVLQAHLHRVQAAGEVALHVANALWPQSGYNLLPAFLEVCETHYGFSITPLDFAASAEACRRINAWVAEQTRGKIEELLSPGSVGPATSLVLTNAIYFKGNWSRQFEEARTQEASFWITAREAVAALLMSKTQTCPYAEFEDLQALELPYRGDDLAMLLLLPRERDGLDALERQLETADLSRWIGATRPREVQVFLPRFKFTDQFELNAALNALGMVDAFAAADFSGITGERDLFLSAVLHKAFVEVNEEGTEAAAATGVIMARSMASLPPVFRADHPFLFLIRERSTGSILFMGRVANPVAQ